MKYLTGLLVTLLLGGCGANIYSPYPAPNVDRSIQPYTTENGIRVTRRVISTRVVPAPQNAAPPAPQYPNGQPVPPPNGWNVAPQPHKILIFDEPKLRPAPQQAAPAPQPAENRLPPAPVVRNKPELVDEPKLDPRPAAPTDTPARDEPKPAKVAVRPAPTPAPQTKDDSDDAAPPPRKNRPAPLRPNTPDQSDDNRNAVASRVPAPTVVETGTSAVTSLIRKASQSLGRQNYDEAVAYLENAQRIDPSNSKILYDIAQIRYRQGRYRDAENFAGKASQISKGNMSRKAWELISKARARLGDKQGAIQAAEKAAQ